MTTAMLLFIFVIFILLYALTRLVPPQFYWIKRKTFHVNVLSRLYAVFLRKTPFVEQVRFAYEEYPDKRYYGSYQFLKPSLFLRDIDLIKQITVKDFDHFTDHVDILRSEGDPVFSKNLFTIKGKQWRKLRNTLSPAFTSSKMRAMFVLISEVAKKFADHFDNLNQDVVEIEMKEIYSKFTNDVIATCAFGIECDTLKDPENEFFEMGKGLTASSSWRFLVTLLNFFFPRLFQLFKIPTFPVDIVKFFKRIITDTIEMREKEGTIRPDLIHLLMEARKGKLTQENQTPTNDAGFATVEEFIDTETNSTLEITDDVITAQGIIFFLAGFDTSSTLLAFLSYEIAKNQKIQEKLQAEIDSILPGPNGIISYDQLSKMKYLDQVISEALRKWTPGYAISRECTKDYVIPPVKEDEVPLTLSKGCYIMISTIGIHHDPQFFEDPDVFDPERFNDENKRKIVPGTYFPFGMGPRNCIGSRFALLEMKAVLISLLSKFEFEFIEKTPVPLKLGYSFSIVAKGGIWLGLKRRTRTSASQI